MYICIMALLWLCSKLFHSGIQADGGLPIWDSGVPSAKRSKNMQNHGSIIFCLEMT